MLNILTLNGLKQNGDLKHKAFKALIAFITLALLSGLSCGKRKPPLPPVERVPQRVEASAFQRGNRVIISWKMPARNAPKNSVLNISRADIYRLAEPSNAPLSLSEEEFASRSLLIATVPITDSDFGLKTMSYTDTLQFAGQPVRLRYAVRFANKHGQKAGFSNFLLIEPAARIAGAPAELKTELSQDEMTLTWTSPPANVDGSTPPNVLGYNVYRSASEKETAKLLNKTPITKTEYEDKFFEFDKEYFYFVRAVSVGTGGEPVESQESNIVKILPKDTFPPSPPAAITIAAAPNAISIFWAVNPEKDIAGYRIYRVSDDGVSMKKQEWELLTPELLTTNSFEDTRVESGIKYLYYLTAVDKHGNVSKDSEVVSETAP